MSADIITLRPRPRTAVQRQPLSDGAALAQISELLIASGFKPSCLEEVVAMVGSHIRMNREHSRIIHDMTVANQAAWIEWQHGGGAEEAMQWIENGLSGPGLLPGMVEDDIAEDDPILKNAQAYFDRYAGWSTEPNPKSVKVIEGRHRAAKNDRELLDFVESIGLTLTQGRANGEPAFLVLRDNTAEGHQNALGCASTAREALRAAIRATDPQGDLLSILLDAGSGA